MQAIEARYAKLDDRTFPVAVIFVVPETIFSGSPSFSTTR